MNIYISTIEQNVLNELMKHAYGRMIPYIKISDILKATKLSVEEIELSLYSLKGKGVLNYLCPEGVQLFPDALIFFQVAAELMNDNFLSR